jgi:hypothetical protein
MDGQRTPKPGGAACFYCIDRSRKDPKPHFYRLCVSTAKKDGRRVKARFWHYIGTKPDAERRPTLSPPARLFK